jgi:hypothetical protein
MPMRNVICSLLFVAAATGCSKGSDCDKIFDKTLSWVPAEMQDQVKEHKDEAIAKCEKMSPEAKECAANATSMAELRKCAKN